MKAILYLSDFLVPAVLFYIIGFGVLSRRPVFDDFIRGAQEGMKTVAGILPTLIGPDSLLGMTASIMESCTETVFYTMSVYFMTAKVTKTRWTLAGAAISTAAGIGASILIAGFLT